MGDPRILLLEPYYGGSHRYFVDGLIAWLPAECTLLRLPARKWKMRMQLSAPWFAEQIRAMPRHRRGFTAVVASTFTDLAVFKAMVGDLPGWNNHCRLHCYFHENQCSYPERIPRTGSHQFAAINFTSALVADAVGFNSRFNRDGFLAHCRTYLKMAKDVPLEPLLEAIEARSRVLYPGLDYREIDDVVDAVDSRETIPLIIWNHRWEHDKNPEEFCQALIDLRRQGIEFRCALLGERFREIPSCFTMLRQTMGERVIQFGFVSDRRQYLELLARGDVVVSTAGHEYFGLAVIEAVRAGCLPVLPDRLVYPELFPSTYLYGTDGLNDRLKTAVLQGKRLEIAEARRLTEPFSWESLADSYRSWLHL